MLNPFEGGPAVGRRVCVSGAMQSILRKGDLRWRGVYVEAQGNFLREYPSPEAKPAPSIRSLPCFGSLVALPARQEVLGDGEPLRLGVEFQQGRKGRPALRR